MAQSKEQVADLFAMQFQTNKTRLCSYVRGRLDIGFVRISDKGEYKDLQA